jgi:O-antigen/teichoic acid export membrane protein
VKGLLRSKLSEKLIPQKTVPAFASDVLKLVGGTAFAQALSVIASPIITRLYSPEAFGVVSLFLAITGIISVIACFRYELAIMLPKEDGEAANLLGLSLLIAVIISALLIPLSWVGRSSLLRLLNAPELAPYILLIPLAVFASGVFIALNYWNSRTRLFGRLSVARINASISTTGAQIVAGLAGYPTGGSLIGANILGSAVSTLILGGQIWRDDRKIFMEYVCLDGMQAGLRRYKKFLLFDTWAALLNSLSAQLPILLLSSFFTSTVIGYYSLGYRVLTLPMGLIGTSLGQVFFQRAAKARFEGNLGELLEKLVPHLVVVSVFPFLILVLFAEELFKIIFGVQWAEAGIYAEILAPWVFIAFVVSPISTLFSVLEKQRISLLENIILVISRAGSLIIGGFLGNVFIALILFSFIGSFINIIMFFWLMDRSGASVRRLFVSVLSSLAISFPLFLAIILTKLLITRPEYIIVICSITMVIYYIIISRDIIKGVFA